MIASPDVVVATGAMANGVALNGRLAVVCAGKVIVCGAAAMVSVNVCMTVPLVFVADKVTGKVPACVGVPEIVAAPGAPAIKVTPAGSVPTNDSVGAGPPVAVTLKLKATLTVPEAEFPEVMTGMALKTGITMTLADAALVSIALLVAVTEQL